MPLNCSKTIVATFTDSQRTSEALKQEKQKRQRRLETQLQKLKELHPHINLYWKGCVHHLFGNLCPLKTKNYSNVFNIEEQVLQDQTKGILQHTTYKNKNL